MLLAGDTNAIEPRFDRAVGNFVDFSFVRAGDPLLSGRGEWWGDCPLCFGLGAHGSLSCKRSSPDTATVGNEC